MNKKLTRLTESDLHRIMKGSVKKKKVLKEESYYDELQNIKEMLGDEQIIPYCDLRSNCM